MDYTATVTDSRLEDQLTDRMRLDAFRLGGSSLSSSTNQHARKSSHARSHSRSHSVSISTNGPSMSSMATTSAATLQAPDSPPSTPPLSTPNPKRNSHHRRRSSVSTRRESAEIMGLSLPALPASMTDDNVNMGDKDSIRRRALWALEGKTDVGVFSKVEIPELNTPEIEKRFEFPTKPSYPPGTGTGYGGGLSGLAGSKRDSFGRFSLSCASKEQLGTLVEEEEEEDEEIDSADAVRASPVVEVSEDESSTSPVEVTITASSPAPVRHRPVGLNLRPLSLASANVVQATNGDLPTPLPTPSPRLRPSLKSLTLAGSPVLDHASNDTSSETSRTAARKRHSLILSTSPVSSTVPTRRSSLSSECPPTVASGRRSSISYFHSKENTFPATGGLPTPEMTPTSDRRYSSDSAGSEMSRGSHNSRNSHMLSSSEHYFLYQAHAALVQRITDLEHALAARPRSRPPSSASEASSSNNEAPNEEIFQVIADLKAERDELKRDVEGWRTRVSDGERQTILLMKRVEAERREAWIARERMGLLEVEKRSLETMLQEKVAWGEEGWRKLEEVEKQLTAVQQEGQSLRAELQRCVIVETECARLAAALTEESKRREDVEKELEGVLATPTPAGFSPSKPPPISRTMVYAKRGGLGFRSVDSTGSNTDVESLDDSFDRHESPLKVVEEEDESDHRDDNNSDCTEDELARYEDEEEDDSYVFQASLSDSSFDSMDDLPRDASHLLEDSVEDMPQLTETRSNTASPVPASPRQSHAHRNSLCKTWTFPVRTEPPLVVREPEEIDRFFGCLEDVDNSPPLHAKLMSVESGKNLFSRALADADDMEPPFMLPANIGLEISESHSLLDVVIEEEEEDAEEEDKPVVRGPNHEFIGEEVEGGIIFTFSLPPLDELANFQPEDVSAVETGEQTRHPDVSSSDNNKSISPSRSLSRIPVPKSTLPPPPSTPVKTNTVSFPRSTPSPSAFFTPPRRDSFSSTGQVHGLFESPQAMSTPFKKQPPSFIPQPMHKTGAMATPMKTQQKPRMSIVDEAHGPPFSGSTSEINQLNAPHTDSVQALSPVMSPMSTTIAARISLQKLTNLIPLPSLPWSSPVLGSAPSIAAASLCLLSSSSSSSVTEDMRNSQSSSVNHPPATTSQVQARRYVSKAQQLQKLRVRLEEEKRARLRIAAPSS